MVVGESHLLPGGFDMPSAGHHASGRDGEAGGNGADSSSRRWVVAAAARRVDETKETTLSMTLARDIQFMPPASQVVGEFNIARLGDRLGGNG